jgi:hypothetical protein
MLTPINIINNVNFFNKCLIGDYLFFYNLKGTLEFDATHDRRFEIMADE